MQAPNFKSRPLVFSEFLLMAEHHIWPEYPGGPHVISESAAEQLYVASKTDPGAFALLSNVCQGLLLHDRPLNPPLRLFVVNLLSEAEAKPKAPKAALTNEFNLYNLVLILLASSFFALPPTRNNASEPTSACDALSVAFEASGRGLGRNFSGTSFASLKKLFEARNRTLLTHAFKLAQMISRIPRSELKSRLGWPDILEAPGSSADSESVPVPQMPTASGA